MRFAVLLFTLLIPAISESATFSVNNGAGSSTIGTTPGCDYASLAAAANDFNSYSSGMTGNYTFYIASDLNEPTDVYFGNATNNFTLTFKPAPAATPTITFSSTSSAGYLGKWVFGAIGSFNNTSATYRSSMANIVIDGSNTPNGTTRDLKITNTPEDTIPTNYCTVLEFVADCDNAVLKNCSVHQVTESALTTKFAPAVQFITRSLNTPQVRLVPDSPTIENCEIKSKGTNVTFGVTFRRIETSGVSLNNYTTTGTIIRGCDFECSYQGLMLGNNTQFTVEDCTFALNQQGNHNGFSSAIAHENANSNLPWAAFIRRNKMLSMRSANPNSAGGLVAISCRPNTSQPFTYRIENNMIGGFQFDPDSSTASRYNAIYCNNPGGTLEILHNSINMPLVPHLGSATGKCHALVLDSSPTNTNLILQNNIIRMMQNNLNSSVYYAGSHPLSTFPPQCDNNNIIFAAPVFADLGDAPNIFTTLADWQASAPTGRDNNSFSVDPFFTSGSKWTSDSDLHFTPENLRPQGTLPVPYLSDIPLDGDKETRSNIAGQNYPGADYLTAAPLPVSISAFSVE